MSKTHQEFILELSAINPRVKVLGTYTLARNRIEVQCLQCGKCWSPYAYSLLQGKSCPHCSAVAGAQKHKGKTKRKTKDEFCQELSSIDNNIKVIGEYTNTHTDILCECAICHTRWSAKPYSLLQGHGCPRCAKSGTSFMEQFILLCFKAALEPGRVFSRDKKAIGMELDIYIPDLKIAIEPGNWFLHRKSLERDRLKRELCAKKGITLFTIYDKFPEDIPVPFDTNCYVFKNDLNKSDHAKIHNLIYELFAKASVSRSFSDDEFYEIEMQSYENAKAKTHNDFLNEMQTIHPYIEVLGTYLNANIPILVKCKKCGYTWNSAPANLLSGDGCRKCGSILAHTPFIKAQDLFVAEVNKANPTIEILGTYTGRHNPVLARCKICGYEWNPIAASLLRGSSHRGNKRIHREMNEKSNVP